ncbi:MAG: hypothetical protein M3082_18350 [Candidatus Dormibacteraeota bacterium]|nr:hypothetical protein [Candidatus Dormibacteraeota bacterium]
MSDEELDRSSVSTREQVERKAAELEMKARALAQRHGRLAAGLALGAVAAFGLGMMVYRRRQRKSMVRRVQNAIPDMVWDLPEELVAQLKTQLKKPLQRAAKSL